MPVGERNVLYLSFEKLDVLYSGLLLILLRQGQHLVSHVQPIRLPARGHPPRREQHVYTATTAEVQNDLPRRQHCERHRVSATQRSIGGKLGQLTFPGFRVAPPGHVPPQRTRT